MVLAAGIVRIGVPLDPVAAPQVDGGVGDQSSGS